MLQSCLVRASCCRGIHGKKQDHGKMTSGSRQGSKVCQNPWEAREGLRCTSGWAQWPSGVWSGHGHGGRFFLSTGRCRDDGHCGQSGKELTWLTADCCSPGLETPRVSHFSHHCDQILRKTNTKSGRIHVSTQSERTQRIMTGKAPACGRSMRQLAILLAARNQRDGCWCSACPLLFIQSGTP